MIDGDWFNAKGYGDKRAMSPLFEACTVEGSKDQESAKWHILNHPLHSEWFDYNIEIIQKVFQADGSLRDKHFNASLREVVYYSYEDPFPVEILDDIQNHPLFTSSVKRRLTAQALQRPGSIGAVSAGLPGLGKRN